MLAAYRDERATQASMPAELGCREQHMLSTYTDITRLMINALQEMRAVCPRYSLVLSQ